MKFLEEGKSKISLGTLVAVNFRIICLPVSSMEALYIRLHDCLLVGCENDSFSKRQVFANRVLRRIFVPEGGSSNRRWRKLHSEKLYKLWSSANVIGIIKSRIIRQTGDLEEI
jgi:hypothetical protein